MTQISDLVRRALKILCEENAQALLRASLRFIDDRTSFNSFILSPYILLGYRDLRCGELLDKLFNGRSILSIFYEPQQIRYEVELKLIKILERLRPRLILEIGTARGRTILLWTRVAFNDATIISIVLLGGPFGGECPYFRGITYRFFSIDKQKIHLIRGDSHNPRTLEKVKKILRGKELNFLFIDGDHTYEGVRKDSEMYSPLVRNEGVVAFHDIVPHDRVHDSYGQVGVPKFWNEAKNKYRHLEIVKDLGRGWAGIGVLFLCT